MKEQRRSTEEGKSKILCKAEFSGGAVGFLGMEQF
jgi:hypothetical protein